MSRVHTGDRFETSQVAQLTVTQWKVLLALAYYGQENVYQVAKKYKMTYPAVHRAIRNLSTLGWVKVVRRELTVKNVTSIRYGLTAEGLLWLFARRPKEVAPALICVSRKEKAAELEQMGAAVNRENSEQESELFGQLMNINTNEEVHMHLLFELDIDRIAEKNVELFPVVLGPWKIHQESSVSGLITFSLPEVAFSTLVEIHYDYEGLLEKYRSLDQVFAYKIYKETIESCAHFEPDKNIESEVEHVQRVAKWMHDVSTAYPKAFQLCRDIALELQKNFSNSLSFTNEIVKRLDQDGVAR